MDLLVSYNYKIHQLGSPNRCMFTATVSVIDDLK